MTDKTGMTMTSNIGGTRLDAIVRSLMRHADRYATARAMSAAYGNRHGDEDAAKHSRADLDAALRDELIRLAGEMALAKPDSSPR